MSTAKTSLQRCPKQQDDSSKPQRNFLKCKQCRRDGKPCKPRDRTWTSSTSDKCERCTRLGHPCGPPERAPKKKQDPSGSGLLQATSPCEQEINYSISEVCQVLANGLALQRLLLRCRLEVSQRHLKGRVGAVFDQYDALLQDLSNKIDKWFLDASGHLSLDDEHEQEQKKDPMTLVEAHELDTLHLQSDVLRLQHALMSCGNSSSNLTKLSVQSKPFREVRTQDTYVVLKSTLHTTKFQHSSFLDAPSTTTKCDTGTEDYATTEMRAQALLQTVRPFQPPPPAVWHIGGPNEPRMFLKSGFPASHIAYWNRNREAALRFSMQPGLSEPKTDLLGRTLVHLAVEARDIAFLWELAQMNPLMFASAKSDNMGYTPLQLATILDEADIFSLLVDRGAAINPADYMQHTLLDLAVVVGSIGVAGRILNRGIVPPPYTAVFRIAIENGAIALAHLILPYLSDACWTSRSELLDLSTLAKKKGLSELAVELQDLVPAYSTADNALYALAQYQASFSAIQDLHLEIEPESRPSPTCVELFPLSTQSSRQSAHSSAPYGDAYSSDDSWQIDNMNNAPSGFLEGQWHA